MVSDTIHEHARSFNDHQPTLKHLRKLSVRKCRGVHMRSVITFVAQLITVLVGLDRRGPPSTLFRALTLVKPDCLSLDSLSFEGCEGYELESTDEEQHRDWSQPVMENYIAWSLICRSLGINTTEGSCMDVCPSFPYQALTTENPPCQHAKQLPRFDPFWMRFSGDDNMTIIPPPPDLRPSVITLVGNLSWVLDYQSFWPTSVAHPCTLSLTKATQTKTGTGDEFLTWINSTVWGEPEDLSDNLEPMLHPVPLEESKQQPRQLLQRLSYLISDVVCFAGADMATCVDEFLEWITICSRAGPYDSKPIACIILPVSKSNPEKPFLQECRTKIGELPQFHDWFEDIQFYQLVEDAKSLPEEIETALVGSRKARKTKRHLWSPSILQALCRDAVNHFARRPLEKFSFVKSLMPAISSGLLREKPWLDLSQQVAPAKTIVAILASCFAREEEIPLQIPLRQFFDLIGGSSVGGIIAIELGISQVSLSESPARFRQLAQAVFGRSRPRWLPRILQNAIDVGHIIWNDGLYDSGPALVSALGSDLVMYGAANPRASSSHQVKTFVTAVECRRSISCIFTTYNKIGHRDPYHWAQQDHSGPPLKAHEVRMLTSDLLSIRAACTSAAPAYFPRKLLGGKAYQDGGMVFNCALNVMLNEAWGLLMGERNSGSDDALAAGDHISIETVAAPGSASNRRPRGLDYAVIVGCGQFRTAPCQRTSCWSRFLYTTLSNLTAHKQYINGYGLLEEALGHRLSRLDFSSGCEDVGLHAVEKMDDLTKELEEQMPQQVVPLLKSLVPKMIAGLLCFAFDCEPEIRPKQTSVACSGKLFFRYPEHQDDFMRKYIWANKPSLLRVNQTTHQITDLPVSITFNTADYTRPVVLEFDHGGEYAPISGFPCSPQEIWDKQGKVPAMLDHHHRQSKKRKFGDGDDGTSSRSPVDHKKPLLHFSKPCLHEPSSAPGREPY
ncbi:MAG: hypothetical protein M1816_002232 [Peltula sp. TS41687]|nr:MAG: hypothetical protein M1816_002232 [Peltula sp. TS41687]